MYKDVAGAAFKFNILDGKQRLDSIVMFLAGDANSKCRRLELGDTMYSTLYTDGKQAFLLTSVMGKN